MLTLFCKFFTHCIIDTSRHNIQGARQNVEIWVRMYLGRIFTAPDPTPRVNVYALLRVRVLSDVASTKGTGYSSALDKNVCSFNGLPENLFRASPVHSVENDTYVYSFKNFY